MSTPVSSALLKKRHLFSVEEYYKMALSGIFSEDDRVELIEGEVTEMTPISSKHALCVKRLNKLFSQLLGDNAIVSVQDPVRLDKYSEPQPDIALIRPPFEKYVSSHPSPGDVFLIVEVAETSYDYDRWVKVPLYGKHNIPEVWLIDLNDEKVEVFRNPFPEGYKVVETFFPDDTIPLSPFPSLQIRGKDIFTRS